MPLMLTLNSRVAGGGEEGLAEVQPHQIVRFGGEARNRVGEVAVAAGLVDRCRRRISHVASIDGVGVIDRAAAGEVFVSHERANGCGRAAIDIEEL